MWPTVFGIRTYAVFYVLSMIVHMIVATALCERRGVSRKTGVGLGLYYFWSMVVGAKILYDLINRQFEWRSYLDIGYYFCAGAWGGPLAYLAVAVVAVMLLARARRATLDIVALSLPVPMMLAKVSCFVNGCCYGAESSLPWAMSLVEGAAGPAGIPLHPTPLYEILMLIVILIVLVRLDGPRWQGMLVVWFVMLYGIGRPLTELFRSPDQLRMPIGPFSASQVTCVAAAVLAAASLSLLRPPQHNRLRSAESSATP